MTSAPRSPMASALPRPLDFSYPSNRLAAAGLVVGILGAKLLGHSWPGSLRVGLGIFSSWAIARELDPDAPQTAGWAMPLAFAGLLGKPTDTEAGQTEGAATVRHALPSFAALSSLRSLVSTVGPATSGQDAASLSGLAAISALTSGSVTRVLPGAALGVSSQLRDAFSPPPWSSTAALAASALPQQGRGAGNSLLGDVLSLAALGLGSHLAAPERINSRCDESPRRVSSERVRAARLLGLGTLALGLLNRETRSLSPLAAAVLSVGLRRWQAAQK